MGTNTTAIATAAYVQSELDNIPTEPQGNATARAANTQHVAEAFNPFVLVEERASVTSSAGLPTIVYTNEVSDLNSAYNNTTGVFTVPTGGAGIYQFHAAIPITNNDASPQPFALGILVNRVAQTEPTRRMAQDSLFPAFGTVVLIGSCMANLFDGDTVEFVIRNFATVSMSYGTASVPSSNYASVVRLGKVVTIE